MQPKLTALDHLVLTVSDIDATIAFYRDVLCMVAEAFTPADGTARWALKFGAQKINLHVAGAEFEPKARHAWIGGFVFPERCGDLRLAGAPWRAWHRG